MKKIATLAFSMATLFNACAMPEDNGTSTAGVLTETESGHTVAFAISEELELDHVVVPKSAKKSGKVQFALTRIVDRHSQIRRLCRIRRHNGCIQRRRHRHRAERRKRHPLWCRHSEKERH